jgi:predicted house-cleaning noncanonical NTP pyrophosphatase (MazG superfamily)
MTLPELLKIESAAKINKLVRSKVPAILALSGKICEFSKMSGNNRTAALDDELKNSVQKYYDSEDPDDLIDVYDIVTELTCIRFGSSGNFQKKRKEKYAEQGGFKGSVFLKNVIDASLLRGDIISENKPETNKKSDGNDIDET